MSEKILVALDQSSMSQQVFQKALALAQSSQSQLMLLHVLSVDEEGSPQLPVSPGLGYYPLVNDAGLSAYKEQWERFEQAGQELLQSLCNQAIATGITTEMTQTAGSPGRCICNLAETWEADLIVLGRRGRRGLSEFLLGSVSNYVLHHAPCSIFVVHAS